MPVAVSPVITNPDRLAILRDLLLLDSKAEPAFDRLTQLASWMLDAPVSLVTLVDADRQFFKSMVGLPDPWATDRETPLSHSFCQHVVSTGQPLIVEDARIHPLVHDNLAIPDLNVIGYLGMPLTTADGTGLGSFCVIDGKPRAWTENEIAMVRELANFVMTEIELRSELIARHRIEANLKETNQQLELTNSKLRRISEFTLATLDQTIETIKLGAQREETLIYLNSAKRGLMNI